MVRLPVSSRLLAIKFQGSQSYTWVFDCAGVGTPNPTWFKYPNSTLMHKKGGKVEGWKEKDNGQRKGKRKKPRVQQTGQGEARACRETGPRWNRKAD